MLVLLNSLSRRNSRGDSSLGKVGGHVNHLTHLSNFPVKKAKKLLISTFFKN
jgi:hypothetical protein